MFDPSKSSSYKTIPYSSPTCEKNVKVVGGCSNNKKNVNIKLSMEIYQNHKDILVKKFLL
jgi:DNA topoisomerase VI subunit B